MYISLGIDAQVVLSDARKKSKSDEVTVHFHPRAAEGANYRHQFYKNGELGKEWGEVDGSSLAPVGKR
jgi:hypothetical protein